MPKKNKKELPPSVKEYNKWRNWHYGLKAALIPTAIVPFFVELGVNWNEWFPADKDNTSIGLGLGMALLSLVLSVLAIAKKDTDFMKKVGPFVSVAIAFVAWGVVCIFLASVLNELGKLLLFAGVGILASAVEDAVDKNAVKPKYDYMKEVLDRYAVSKKGEWEESMKELAKKDGVAKRGNPVE